MGSRNRPPSGDPGKGRAVKPLVTEPLRAEPLRGPGGLEEGLRIDGLIQLSPLVGHTEHSGIKAIGNEDRVEKIPVETDDEIGNLAMAFNDMAESLKRRKAENLQLEMQLRQSQRFEALGTLAGGIVHDFNNVLSPIFGYTEMAMDDVPKDGQVYNDLKAVRVAAARARDLVKQILAFSRQVEKERAPIKIQLVIKEALRLLRAPLPTAISITRNINEECGPILADPTSIHRIVMNLCTNAMP